MYESILQFAIDLAMKICQRAENGEIRDLDVMAEAVLGDCKEASIQVMGELIRNMNEGFRKDKQTRKDLGLVIKEKDRSRSLLTALGQIDFSRDYFYDKGNSRYTCVLDQMLGIAKYERVSAAVSAALVTEAAKTSYARASDIVTNGAVSRQSVHDQILKVDVPEVRPRTEKRTVKELHVYADEDHAHMQKPGKKKGKQSKMIPLVTVTEGMYEQSKGRNRTINPMHFADEGFDTKRLWKTTEGYIGKAYELEKIEKVYIHGDGGQWIRNGLENITQAVHVIDGYHFMRELRSICRMLPHRNIRVTLLNALKKDDHRRADRYMQELLDEPLTEKEAKRIRDFAGYLFRFWEEIRRRIIEDIPGSCTEAQVSHVLSERFSRDPLGWSEGPLGKLVGVRVYLKDGGKLTKEAFRQGEELTERYSEYADRLIEEHIKGAVDFSIFETERPIFDGASGTQIRIRGIGMARDMIVH